MMPGSSKKGEPGSVSAVVARFHKCVIFAVASLLLCLPSQADEVQDCSRQGLLDAIIFDGEALFTEDCNITIDAPISITNDVVIDAQGFNVSISGSNQFLIFEITSNASLTISGVTITGGQNTNGGAFFVHDGCALTLTECTLAGNQAIGTNGLDGANGSNSSNGNGGNGRNATPATPAYGGAIFNLGSVTLINCTVSTNSAKGGTGGNGGNGGNSAAQLGIGGNGGAGTAGAAAFGGAIYHAGDSLTISNCVFSGNSVAGGNGGTGGTAGTGHSAGLAGSGGAGTQGSGAAVYSTNEVLIVQSTFVNNSAHGGDSAAGGTDSNGGGISGARGGDSFGGGLFTAGGEVTNCTFYLNDTAGGKGGDGGPGTSTLGTGGNGGNGGNATGAALYNSNTNVDLFVVSCTISNCSAVGGTNGAAGTGSFPGTAGNKGASHGSIANGSGAFDLLYTILATNVSGGAAFGTIQDVSYNITFGNTLTLKSGSHSFKTNDVKLGPLTDNGGFTPTMALQVGSPALDRIPITNEFPETDQRGQPRPQGPKVDIGAYEAGPPLVQVTNQIASLGSDVTFTAFAAGDPPITYQWRLFGTDVPRATSPTFVVTNASPANRGPYDVIVNNSYGSATSGPVFVNFAPTIISQPTSQTVEQGNTATISVTNTGDTPLTYRWYFQGTNGGATNIVRQFTNTSAAPTNSDVLTISSVFPTNLGTYFVSVSNKYSSVTSAPVSLTFGARPAIVSQPASVTTNAGSSVNFNVTASGNPAPTFQWQFNGTNLGGANGTSFTLSNVQTNNSGSYTVVVSNSVSSITSAPAVLIVSGSAGPEPATITVQPVSQIVVAGSNATFSVVAEGTPPLTYQWRFNGVNIAGATLSSYTRVHAQTNHAGFYDVFVSNGYGSDESDPNVTLRILTAPVSISNLGLSVGTFSFSFGSQAGFTYVVQYKNTLSTSNWTTLITTNGTGAPITVQDSFSNNPSRFYRVRAQ
jgi:hypothetical protein